MKSCETQGRNPQTCYSKHRKKRCGRVGTVPRGAGCGPKLQRYLTGSHSMITHLLGPGVLRKIKMVDKKNKNF